MKTSERDYMYLILSYFLLLHTSFLTSTDKYIFSWQCCFRSLRSLGIKRLSISKLHLLIYLLFLQIFFSIICSVYFLLELKESLLITYRPNQHPCYATAAKVCWGQLIEMSRLDGDHWPNNSRLATPDLVSTVHVHDTLTACNLPADFIVHRRCWLYYLLPHCSQQTRNCFAWHHYFT